MEQPHEVYILLNQYFTNCKGCRKIKLLLGVGDVHFSDTLREGHHFNFSFRILKGTVWGRKNPFSWDQKLVSAWPVNSMRLSWGGGGGGLSLFTKLHKYIKKSMQMIFKRKVRNLSKICHLFILKICL